MLTILRSEFLKLLPPEAMQVLLTAAEELLDQPLAEAIRVQQQLSNQVDLERSQESRRNLRVHLQLSKEEECPLDLILNPRHLLLLHHLGLEVEAAANKKRRRKSKSQSKELRTLNQHC